MLICVNIQSYSYYGIKIKFTELLEFNAYVTPFAVSFDSFFVLVMVELNLNSKVGYEPATVIHTPFFNCFM